MNETTDNTKYNPDDYVLVHINIKVRAEKRRIRELNEKLELLNER